MAYIEFTYTNICGVTMFEGIYFNTNAETWHDMVSDAFHALAMWSESHNEKAEPMRLNGNAL